MPLHSCHGAHAHDDYQSRFDAVGFESIGFQFGKYYFTLLSQFILKTLKFFLIYIRASSSLSNI